MRRTTNNNKSLPTGRGKKELFFVQNILFFVQKIKKRLDKLRETRARIKKTCPRFETLAGMFYKMLVYSV